MFIKENLFNYITIIICAALIVLGVAYFDEICYTIAKFLKL